MTKMSCLVIMTVTIVNSNWTLVTASVNLTKRNVDVNRKKNGIACCCKQI